MKLKTITTPTRTRNQCKVTFFVRLSSTANYLFPVHHSPWTLQCSHGTIIMTLYASCSSVEQCPEDRDTVLFILVTSTLHKDQVGESTYIFHELSKELCRLSVLMQVVWSACSFCEERIVLYPSSRPGNLDMEWLELDLPLTLQNYPLLRCIRKTPLLLASQRVRKCECKRKIEERP